MNWREFGEIEKIPKNTTEYYEIQKKSRESERIRENPVESE